MPGTYVPALIRLGRAAFNGTEFPVEDVSVTGSIRDHVHVYPHAVGGSPEKMGRNLYLVRMQANFQETFQGTTGAVNWPGLWPGSLNKLRHFFEDQTTGDLTIPTVGIIKAYCRNWTTTMNARILSGEKATFEFVEDADSRHLVDDVRFIQSQEMPAKVREFDDSIAEFRSKPNAPGDLFDAISSVANFILSIGDTIQTEGHVILSKLLKLQGYFQQLDGHRFVQDPANAVFIEAFYNLRDAANQTAKDLQKKGKRVLVYATPRIMPMADVSVAIYGDTSHTVDLMQMNVVEDVFRVPAGFSVTYYASDDATGTKKSTF